MWFVTYHTLLVSVVYLAAMFSGSHKSDQSESCEGVTGRASLDTGLDFELWAPRNNFLNTYSYITSLIIFLLPISFVSIFISTYILYCSVSNMCSSAQVALFLEAMLTTSIRAFLTSPSISPSKARDGLIKRKTCFSFVKISKVK